MAREGQHDAQLKVTGDAKSGISEMQALAKRVAALESQANSASTSLGKMSAEEKKLAEEAKKASRELEQQAKKGAQLAEQAARNAEALRNKTTAANKEVIKSLGQAFLGAFGGGVLGAGLAGLPQMIGAASAAINDFADRATALENVMGNLAFPIDKAREATRGLVTDFDLAVSQNMLVSTGVKLTDERFAQLAKGAQILGARINQGPKESLESLSIALARGSKLMLDNIGIILNEETAQREYAAQIGKTAAALTEQEKKLAFQEIAIQRVVSMSAKASFETGGLGASFRKAAVDARNWTDAIVSAVDQIGPNIGDLRKEINSFLVDLGVAMGVSIETSDKVADAWQATVDAVVVAARDGALEIASFGFYTSKLETDLQDATKAATEFLRVTRGFKGLPGALEAAFAAEDAKVREQQAQSDRDRIVRIDELTAIIERKIGLQKIESRGQVYDIGLQRQMNTLMAERAALELKLAQAEPAGDAASQKAQRLRLDKMISEERHRLVKAELELADELEDREVRAEKLADKAESTAKRRLAALEAQRKAIDELAQDSLARIANRRTLTRGIAEQQGDISLARIDAGASTQDRTLQEQELRQQRRREMFEQEKGLDEERMSWRGAVEEDIAIKAEAGAARLRAAEDGVIDLSMRRAEIERQRLEASLDVREQLATLDHDQAELLRIQTDREEIAHQRKLDRIDEELRAEQRAAQQHARILRTRNLEAQRSAKAQENVLQQVQQFTATGLAFATTIAGAAIKNDERRARAFEKFQGIQMLVTGAVEVVRAATSFASFDFVSGALHTAAAALAFTQGGLMLSGHFSSGGGASSGSTGGGGMNRGSRPSDLGGISLGTGNSAANTGPGAGTSPSEVPIPVSPRTAEQSVPTSSREAPRDGRKSAGAGTKIEINVHARVIDRETVREINKMADELARSEGMRRHG